VPRDVFDFGCLDLGLLRERMAQSSINRDRNCYIEPLDDYHFAIGFSHITSLLDYFKSFGFSKIGKFLGIKLHPSFPFLTQKL